MSATAWSPIATVAMPSSCVEQTSPTTSVPSSSSWRNCRPPPAALAKGIKLFAVGASGLDPVGEYVFRQAAQYTGGRFVFLTYAHAHEVRDYSVETLDRLIVRLVREEMAAWPRD